MDNSAIFRKGIEKFRERVMKPQLMDALVDCGVKLLLYAAQEHDFHSLTGNTLTSFMVGVYDGAKLKCTMSVMDVTNVKRPTYHKISSGTGWTGEFWDYDSGRKVVINRANMDIATDEGYGSSTSLMFLRSYHPYKDGYTLVFTTGTEYSEYLVDIRNLNVIGEGSLHLKSGLFLQSLKPIN